jgi:group II intron reverse transcriptase/maturase
VEQARKYAQKGAEFVVSIDLSKFFDRVNHDRLMSRLARRIKDKRVLKLIRAFLNSGILMEDDAITYPGEGTPQGGPLSPLLSNIVLDELDKELEKRGLSFVRYADDIAIFVRSPVAGERVKKSVIRFLANRMKLKVNEEKSGVDRVENMKFLGFAINARGWVARPFIHPDALKRFKVKVREITRRTRGANVHVVIRELNRFVPAWTNYYRIGLRYKLIKQLNSWIVRRLRAYLWKQWKLPRTKVRNLMNSGVYRRSALWTGCSRKGAWRMSRHPSVRTALPASRFIKEYGLLPIRKKLPA